MGARFRLAPFLVSCLFALACTDEPPASGPSRPPGLAINPERLAFLCVTPGCDETLSLNVTVVGDRRVAIKRVLLSGDENGDFSFVSSEEPPFIIGGNSGFTVDVRYAPKGAPSSSAVELLITYTDASPEESEDRLEAGELRIPLVRRVVGEPQLEVAPKALSFGVVTAGESRTLPLTISNEGFGNVALELASVESDHEAVTATLPEEGGLVPGASAEVEVTFSPTVEGYVQATLLLTPTQRDLPPASVKVEGTSLTTPRLGIEPQGDIDFGEVPREKSRVVTATLSNEGGQPLTLEAVTVVDLTKNLKVSLPSETLPITVEPLERVPLTIELTGTKPAEVDAEIRIETDDPEAPVRTLRVYGTVTEPKLGLSPKSIDFGTVPAGWVVRRPVELRNIGYGMLTVKNITLVSGSSSLFTLQHLPQFPATLKRDQRLAVEVEFRGETQASFSGWLSVESDDPDNPFLELPLSAVAGSCAQSCPIANGSPECSQGICAVGSCNTGYHDVDKSAANGCECKEPNTDPGAFCSDGVYKGSLKDTDGVQVTHVGIIPSEDDVDVIRFHAEDAGGAGQVFGDDFDVKVRLDSSDPNILFCIYRHKTKSHVSECYWTEENCPASRSYRKDGSYGSEDGADFIVKVYRKAGTAPTCTSYTLFMSNGR